MHFNITQFPVQLVAVTVCTITDQDHQQTYKCVSKGPPDKVFITAHLGWNIFPHENQVRPFI